VADFDRVVPVAATTEEGVLVAKAREVPVMVEVTPASPAGWVVVVDCLALAVSTMIEPAL
jgi:hypothetical protein